jgi:hypothetical protein
MLTFGQFTLPTKEVLKSNKVSSVTITKHNLPSSDADSSETMEKSSLDKASFVWAKYWFNAEGLPDSMYNFMQNVAYRKEVYTYRGDEMTAIEVTNHRRESANILKATKLKKGDVVYRNYVKGELNRETFCNKNKEIYFRRILTNARIYGYDSIIYIDDIKADTSMETYYLNGKVSHQLSKRWKGTKPDSFFQDFYQSNAEAGRMPSYSVAFKVTNQGRLMVPNDVSFPAIFEVISYDTRHTNYDPFNEKLGQLLQVDSLATESTIVIQKRPNVIHRHYYTFDYAYD